jgi:L-glutamine-phosphate cytidylyltransferase
MKVIILAAGMGKRLASGMPKPLTLLEGNKTILDYQIESLREYVSLKEIMMVVGYKKKMIIERYPQLKYTFNKRYAKTNNSKSLLLALKHINNEDIILLNGDIFFDGMIIKKIISNKQSYCVVNSRKCGKEEMKYILDGQGYIKRISKKIKKNNGEALGIYYINKKYLDNLKDELSRVRDDDYFENAFENLTLTEQIKLLPYVADDYFCHEIDFKEDLKIVNKYILGTR